MRILIVSHNTLSRNSNMGRTMLSYFRDQAEDEYAQFYIHSEIPTDGTLCRNYYRFTDRDAIRSLNPLISCGRSFGEADIQKDRIVARTDTGFTAKVYQFGRKRTGGIRLARNLLWKLSRWETKQLWDWVDDFGPDVIFFASGDYGFMYDVARRMAEHTGKPLAVACVDDYYLHNRNEGSLLGRLEHKLFLKTVRKTMAWADCIFTICESLKEQYASLFPKPCHVLHTAATVSEGETLPCSGNVSYLGNLGLGRAGELVTIGRTLKEMGRRVDVYSGERNLEILKVLTEENGIRFHGAVSAEEVGNIMASSLAVIHTESFDPKMQDITRYSVSTKIADSLMNGPAILAYGPRGIASIDYLQENRAAYVISDPDDLAKGLTEFLSDEALRSEIVANARALAKQNHDPAVIPANVRGWLQEICSQWSGQ